MNSSGDESSDSMCLTPPDIKEEAKLIIEDLLPTKSKEKYLIAYEKFMQWKIERKSKSLSENVLLAYFNELSKKMKPSSLWNTYSMLKCTVLRKHNLNIKDYRNLTCMLKKKSDGYKCKKSKVLTGENVEKFLNEAPDSKYLAVKVVLIFGINGACRCIQIANITVNDIETHKDIMIITLRNDKTKVDRTFVVRDSSFTLVQKYQALRPYDVKTNRFFLNYRNCKCTKQVLGRHKIAQMPKMIAEYLNLPNPEQFTAQCFRRSSASLLADAGANLITLRQHGELESDRVVESDKEESVENKSMIRNQISKMLNQPTTSHQEASTSAQERLQLSTMELEGVVESDKEESVENRSMIRNQIGKMLNQPTPSHQEASTSAQEPLEISTIELVGVAKSDIRESVENKRMIRNQISKMMNQSMQASASAQEPHQELERWLSVTKIWNKNQTPR